MGGVRTWPLSPWTPEDVTAAGTVALAFLTLVLALGTFFLWLATRRLVKDSKKTAERQLRAYVFIEEGSIVLNQFGFWNIQITFRNFGKTPAYRHST